MAGVLVSRGHLGTAASRFGELCSFVYMILYNLRTTARLSLFLFWGHVQAAWVVARFRGGIRRLVSGGGYKV